MTRLFDYENHRVIEESDPVKAEELISAGKAKKLILPGLDEMERKADELHANYKKEVQRVKESDNPLLQDEKVQAYELGKIEEEYRAKSAEVEAKYTAWRAEQIAQAKTRAAQAVVKVSDNDRAVAEQFRNRASLKLASAIDAGEALVEIKNEIDLLTDEQKTALQGEITGLLAGIEGNQTYKQAVIAAVQDIRNEDLLAVKVAEQLPYTVLTKQRRDDIVQQVMSETSSVFRGGSLTREQYEELKEDN